jgi:hypothetical protein
MMTSQIGTGKLDEINVVLGESLPQTQPRADKMIPARTAAPTGSFLICFADIFQYPPGWIELLDATLAFFAELVMMKQNPPNPAMPEMVDRAVDEIVEFFRKLLDLHRGVFWAYCTVMSQDAVPPFSWPKKSSKT